MEKELEKINQDIERLSAELEELNNKCADSIAEITGKANGRILSFGQEEELNSAINGYTKKIASIVAELEELEKLKEFLEENL